jgi:hypothetical protein
LPVQEPTTLHVTADHRHPGRARRLALLEQRSATIPTDELVADLAAMEPVRAAAWAATALAAALIARGLGSVVRGPRAPRRE